MNRLFRWLFSSEVPSRSPEPHAQSSLGEDDDDDGEDGAGLHARLRPFQELREPNLDELPHIILEFEEEVEISSSSSSAEPLSDWETAVSAKIGILPERFEQLSELCRRNAVESCTANSAVQDGIAACTSEFDQHDDVARLKAVEKYIEKIRGLESKNRSLQSQLDLKTREFQEVAKEIVGLSRVLAGTALEIVKYRQLMLNAEARNEYFVQRIQELRMVLLQKNKRIQDFVQRVQESRTVLQQKDKRIQDFVQRVKELRAVLRAKHRRIQDLETKRVKKRLERRIQELTTRLRRTRDTKPQLLAKTTAANSDHKRRIQELKTKLRTVSRTRDAKIRLLHETRDANLTQERRIQELLKTVSAQERRIQQRKFPERQLLHE